MKKILFLLIVIFLLSGISALNLEVSKKSSDKVMIKEFQNPVFFDLEIKNLGKEDNIFFYNLIGLNMAPGGKINIKEGETKRIRLEVSPMGSIDTLGHYTFSYFIRGEDKEDVQERLTFKIVPLEEVFEISSEEIYLGDEEIKIYLENKVNYYFQDISGEFSSSFFKYTENFSINAYEKKEFDIELNEDIKRAVAGFYSFNVDLDIHGEEINLEKRMKLNEKDSLLREEESSGFFIREKIIREINEGNTVIESKISIEKGIFSRVFTSFNIEPYVVERNKNKINYIWREQLSPGEQLEIQVKTNWFIPLGIVLLLVFLVVILKKYSQRDVELKKRLSFVKTKGGEFALKVTLIITAKEYVEKVNLIDKLPPLVKLYHKFTREEPTRISDNGRRLEWDFPRLEKGEKRLVNYVVYSKIGVLGKFALPSAIAIFEKDGKIKESGSNKAFFVSEQKGREEDIY